MHYVHWHQPQEGSQCEFRDGDIQQGRRDIDKPVGKQGRDPQEQEVVYQFFSIFVNLRPEILKSFSHAALNQPFAQNCTHHIAHAGTCGCAKTD
jgi:hypothetical protein